MSVIKFFSIFKRMEPLLLYRSFRGGPQQVHRINQSTVLVGRGANIQVELNDDPMVSRRHARLFFELGTWWVEDLGSSNGTYLNQVVLMGPMPLKPGDKLQLGDTLLSLEFNSSPEFTPKGEIKDRSTVMESTIPADISEDKNLEILMKVARITAHSKGQAMLEAFLTLLGDVFPQTQQRSIAVLEGDELIPRLYWPPDQSRISFTLARQAIRRKESIHWVRNEEDILSPSMLATKEALYAPMLSGGQSLGVVHIDIILDKPEFKPSDLSLLTIVTTLMGAALRWDEHKSLPTLPTVFISYAHKNRETVDQLAADLRRQQVKVWFDERLKSGVEWQDVLAKAIQYADVFLLLVTPESMQSKYVEWEWKLALESGKMIIPLLFQDASIPEPIVKFQYADFRTGYAERIFELSTHLHDLNIKELKSWNGKEY